MSRVSNAEAKKKFRLNKGVFFYFIRKRQNMLKKEANYYDYRNWVIDFIATRYADASPDERTLMMKNVVVSEHSERVMRYGNSYFEEWLYNKLSEAGAFNVKEIDPSKEYTYVFQSAKYIFLVYQYQLGRFQVYGFSKKVFELVDDELEEDENIILDRLL